MTWLGLVYVYKGHWEDAYFPSSYFFTCIDPEPVLVIELGFPPVYSSELPLQAERAIPYLRDIVSSEDLLNMIRLGFISILIGSCLAKASLNQTCSR
jgi:hypothetical protein